MNNGKQFLLSDEEKAKLFAELCQTGYVVLKNFATADELLCLREFSDFVEAVFSGLASSDCIIFAPSEFDYMQLRSSEISTIAVRGKITNWDIGMIDMFNPNFAAIKQFPELESLFSRLKCDSLLSLLKLINPKTQSQNTNLYVHRGVMNPRKPHIDSIRDYFKSFLAISDHSLPGSGPLGVIPGSHSKKLKNYIMCFYNNKVLKRPGDQATDATFYFKEPLVPIDLCPGDLALCNVSMVHGAIPAASRGYRSTLVQCYDI